jgi:hypothetical protein
MKVKELIERLQQFDPDAPVVVHAEGIEEIEEIYTSYGEIYTSGGVVILDAEYYGEPLALDATFAKRCHEL